MMPGSVFSINSASQVTITNSIAHAVASEGLYVNQGSTVTVSDTEIHTNGKYGIRVKDATTTVTALRCRIADNPRSGAFIEAGTVNLSTVS